MFAVVRTGGKQYRVAAGDKIAVEKIPGEAGDSITLGDVLLAGTGGDVKAGDVTVAAEIVAQAKGEKVIVFKKRRRHNYRRKAGHRQQYTILKIVSIGGQKAEGEANQAASKKAAKTNTSKDALVDSDAPLKVEGAEGQIDTPAAAKAEVETAQAEPVVAEAPVKDGAGEAAPKKKSTKKAAADKDAAEGAEDGTTEA